MGLRIDENLKTGGTPFPVGVLENVTITGLSYQETPLKGLTVSLKTEDGQETNLSILAANDNADEELQQGSLKKFKRFMEAFMPADQIVMDAPDWESLINQVIRKIGNSYQGKLYRVKVTYNKKGFLQLGSGYNIEPMDAPKTQVILNRTYDILDRPERAEAKPATEKTAAATDEF